MALYTSDIQDQLHEVKKLLKSVPDVERLYEALEDTYYLLVELLSEYDVDVSEFYID